jgi:hypothetical protein
MAFREAKGQQRGSVHASFMQYSRFQAIARPVLSSGGKETDSLPPIFLTGICQNIIKTFFLVTFSELAWYI